MKECMNAGLGMLSEVHCTISSGWVHHMPKFQTQEPSSHCPSAKCPAQVWIDRETMSRMIVGEKISRRAVLKEKWFGQVCFQLRRWTPKETYLE